MLFFFLTWADLPPIVIWCSLQVYGSVSLWEYIFTWYRNYLQLAVEENGLPFPVSEEYDLARVIAGKSGLLKSGILKRLPQKNRRLSGSSNLHWELLYVKLFFHSLFTLLVVAYMCYSFSAWETCKYVYIILCMI